MNLEIFNEHNVKPVMLKGSSETSALPDDADKSFWDDFLLNVFDMNY